MADIAGAAQAATSGALAAAAGAATSGMPPTEVIAWSIIGGLVAVWLDRKRDAVLSARWALGAAAKVAVCSASGIALSAAAQAVAPTLAWLSPLSMVPRWALGFVIASLLFVVTPFVVELLKARFMPGTGAGAPQGGDHAGG